MKVALIGASGNVGSRILAELIARGHHVTAIVRHPEKIAPQDHVTPLKGDVADQGELSRLIGGHDVVISAVQFVDSDPKKLIGAALQAHAPRYLVVGGAGSLEVAPGVKLHDSPQFPAEYKAEAVKGGAFLNLLRGEPTLAWTFLSPSAFFGPGERTGKFRLGTDQLLVDDQGKSSISYEDFAVALVDELERPAHTRQRFTVGY